MQRYLFSSAITTSFTAIKEVQVLKKKTEREETDEELRKRFDEFVRETILTEGNKLREERDYPPLTEEDLRNEGNMETGLIEKRVTEAMEAHNIMVS